MLKPCFKLSLLLILALLPILLEAQDLSADFKAIKNKEITHPQMHYHDVQFGLSKKRNVILRYNPITLAFSGLLYGYQKWLSPQLSSNCYYVPTCSSYSRLLYREFGLVKGTLSTADRLMRCDRISATTFHPISINPHDGHIHESVNRYKFNVKKHSHE